MARIASYWTTDKPAEAKRWAGMEFGAALPLQPYFEVMFHVYRRYAKQWNDVELDRSRDLSEHTQEVLGARVSASDGRLNFSSVPRKEEAWILEIVLAGAFRQTQPRLSHGMNALRSPNDIRRVVLHWAGNGHEAFLQWLAAEEQTAPTRLEYTEYKV